MAQEIALKMSAIFMPLAQLYNQSSRNGIYFLFEVSTVGSSSNRKDGESQPIAEGGRDVVTNFISALREP